MKTASFILLLAGSVVSTLAQSTSQLKTTFVPGPFPTTPLVRHDEIWHYNTGNVPPQPQWNSIGENLLLPTWKTGPGGFGYGDGDDATELSDMKGNYTTVYIRKNFSFAGGVDPQLHLILKIDYDDGFVAYIDGKEVARRHVPGTPGTEPAYNSTTQPDPGHEASAGDPPQPVELIDLGLANQALTAGSHTLAFIGVNHDSGSSDFSLIPDLVLGIPEPPDSSSGGAAGLKLVQHGETWNYFRGFADPQADWKTVADSGLQPTWQSGPGGFGYGDGDDATMPPETTTVAVPNVGNEPPQRPWTTLYIRKTFNVGTLDSSLVLNLTMDYDDGFIAWIDGQEIARGNAPGNVGEQPAYNTVANGNHEASAGTGGSPPETTSIGSAATRLSPGNHVLSIMGFNVGADSSDMSLIADLTADPGAVTGPTFYSVSKTNSVTARIEAQNNPARVKVNGADATYNKFKSRWEITFDIVPLMNRIVVEAFDLAGNLLERKTELLVYEKNTFHPPSTLTANTTWNPDTGVVRVTNDVVVPSGKTLTLAPGAVLLFSAGRTLRVESGGNLVASGTDAQRVYLFPSEGVSNWGDLLVTGSSAQASLQHVEWIGGRLRVQNGSATVSDSLMRDTRNVSLIDAQDAAKVSVHGTFFSRFSGLLLQHSLFEMEKCKLEDVDRTAIEFRQGKSGTFVRQVTIRSGTSDGVYFTDHSTGAVERCFFSNVQGTAAHISQESPATIYGNLILNSSTGISVSDGSIASVGQNTVSGGSTGLRYFEENFGMGPGAGEAYNNILWNVSTGISLESSATPNVSYNDFTGGDTFGGIGNLNLDPLFVSPGQEDFSLSGGSPARKSGRSGNDMGAIFGVGGRPDAPANLIAKFQDSDVKLTWVDPNEDEIQFVLERTQDTNSWTPFKTLPPNTTSYIDPGLGTNSTWYYRAKTSNNFGDSVYSNIASTDALADSDGDGIPNDWESQHGLNPSDPADAARDDDTDGLTNLQEFLAGTDPQQKTSVLRIDSIRVSGQTTTLRFQAVEGKTYTVQYRTSLKPGAWTNLHNIAPQPSTGSIDDVDAEPKSGPRFYRLVTPAQ